MSQQIEKALSAWIARVDEFEFSIMPGSTEFKPGKNERVVEKMDNGAMIYSEDVSTGIGIIKFDIKNTPEALANALVVESRGVVTVSIFTPDGAADRVMRAGVSLNNSSRTSGTDAKIPMEFNGTELE